MPSLPSRKSLENLKRVDLQKLCKVYTSLYLVLAHLQSHVAFQDYGVKANLKSEALIDLLLDTQSVNLSPNNPLSLTSLFCLESLLLGLRVVQSQQEFPADLVLVVSVPLSYMTQMVMPMKISTEIRLNSVLMLMNMTRRKLRTPPRPQLEQGRPKSKLDWDLDVPLLQGALVLVL